MSRLSFTLATLAVAACDQGGKPATAPSLPPTAEVAEAAPAPAAPVPKPRPVAYTPAPGPAYLGVDGAGLFRLDDGALTRLVAHAYPIRHIAIDPRGAIYATAIGGLWKIVDGRVERLGRGIGLDPERIAVGPDGVLWTTDRRSVSRWDGTWTDEPAATFDGELINDLAVDRDGRVWVVQSAALWRLDGDHWAKVDLGFLGAKEPYLQAIALHADGSVYLTGLPGTYAFRDGRWSEAGLGSRYGSVDELVAGPAGHVAASGGVGTLAVQAPTGAVRTVELSDGPAQARRGDVLAIDGAGRAWLATDNGLVIFDRDGGLAQQWLPGTVAGVTGKITAVTTVGDGPRLPTLTTAATGAITGTVLRKGQRIAGATVELCDTPLTMFRKTPCESSTRSYRATTAADGSFRIADVPVGSYGFAVKPAAQWIILIGSNCCTDLVAGGSYDVGSITLD